MSTFRIDEVLRPEYYFVKTSLDPSGRAEYRLNLLDGQMVAHSEDPGLFEMSESSLNVNANKTDRNRYPVGTVFKIKKTLLMTSPRKKWYICSDRVFLQEIEEAVAEDMIESYKKAYDDGVITAVHFEEEEEEDTTAAVEEEEDESYLGHLRSVHPCPTVAKTGFYVKKEIWDQLIRHVARGKNILLIGDSGVGKTELTSLLSTTFTKPLKIHDMGATQDPIASLIGVHRIGKGGTSEFDTAKFVEDIQGDNIILLDEVNRAPLNSNNILFPLLDRRRRIDMSIASSDMDREVEAHENAVFMGTANVGSQFTGTNVLDEAFKNRFLVVRLDYPPQNTEANLLKKRSKVKADDAKKIVRVASQIRAKNKAEELNSTLSIRQTIELAEMVADGFELKEAMTYYMEPLFGEEFEMVADILHGI